MRLFWRRKPIVIEVTNGFGWPVERITLIPGKTVRMTASMTQNVCDRGLPSKDGRHRLTTREFTIPMQIRLADKHEPGGEN